MANDDKTITRWRALLVGVRSYEDATFSQLRYAVQDVEAVADALRNGGYEFVRVLHSDLPEGRPDIAGIDAGLQALTEGADEQTLLLVYFAGHGVVAGEHAYLLPCNRVNNDYARFALGVHELEERLIRSGARVAVLILDACHAGARLGVRAATDPEFVRRVIEQARGLVVLSASNWEGVSYETETLNHGVFTYYLLEALGGAAREGRSPYITASRAYEYVTDRVVAWSEQNGMSQRPTFSNGVHGDPPLVRLPLLPEINPFIVGPAVRDPAHFYGRQVELQAVAGRVGGVSAQSISIVGERRSGKSSLLWQVKNQAGALFHTGHRYLVLYLDLSSATGSSNRALMRTVRRELTQAKLPAWKAADDGDLGALSYTLERMEEHHPDVRLVLLLDEFECANGHPAEFDGLLGELRAEGQLGRLALVTASRVPLADLCAQGRIEVSPFFNIFTQVTLGPLDETSWRALVQDGLGEVSDDDWRFVGDCAGRHPFLTQMAGALLWEARRAGAVDHGALRQRFEAEAQAHRAYWARRQREGA